jgi:hypothetical protein
MRQIARARRWRPAFPTGGARGKLFFYAGATRKGFAAFFHQHHGDHRPHVHLVEAEQPAPAVEYSCDGDHQEKRSHAHSRDLDDENHVKAADHAGHWHFAFAETADILSTPYLGFFQILALDWIIVNFVTENCANDLRLTVDRWARPPSLRPLSLMKTSWSALQGGRMDRGRVCVPESGHSPFGVRIRIRCGLGK